MVSLGYMRRSAMGAWRRWGTLTAWAMLRALGEDAPYPAARVRVVPAERLGATDGLAECMANRESPMDGRRA